MKKFLRWLPALLLFSAVSVACSDDPDNPTPEPDPNPTPGTKVEAQTTEGADITLVATSTDKIEWQVTPHSECLSYRVEFKMRARFAEDYRMALRTEPDMSYEEYTKVRMFATDGTGAGAWKGAVDGVGEPRDFSTDMTIFQGVMIPDAEYQIMVWGCRTDDGNNPAEYTEMTVRTNSAGELIGNPEVALSVITNTRYTQVTYTPNEDCAGFFWWELARADFDEFFESGGTEKEFMDIACSYVLDYATEEVENVRDLLAWGDKDTRSTAVAIAMDGNLTRNPTIFYAHYDLKEPDPNVAPAKYSCEFVKCSSMMLRFDVTFESETTKWVYYCLNPSGGQLPNNEYDLVLNGGWMVSKDDPYQWQYVEPDTDYSIFITATNTDEQVLKMEELDLCQTKPIGTFDQPKDLMKWEKVDGNDKTKFRINFYPNEEQIACYFFMTLEKGMCYPDPVTGGMTDIDLTDPKNVETMRMYMIQHANLNTPLSGKAEAHFTYTACEPDTDYVTFVLAETWDGNFVDVQYMNVRTAPNDGGEDPKVEFGEDAVDKDNMRWSVEIIPNEDVYSMRYLVCTEDEASARIDDLESATDEEKLKAWTEYVMGEAAMTNYGQTTTLEGRITDDMLALAIGIGKNHETGKDVYSDLAVMRLNYDTMESEVLTLSPEAQKAIAKAVAERFEAEKTARVAAKPLPGYGGAHVRIRN